MIFLYNFIFLFGFLQKKEYNGNEKQRGESMEKDLFRETASLLPFPAFTMDENLTIRFRNRLAEKLLPSVRILRSFLAENEEKILQTGVFTCFLGEEHYLVFRFRSEKGECLLGFLENFLPFYESLSRLILERSEALFWELNPERLLSEVSENRGKNTEFLDLVASRMVLLRKEERIYLRLLKMKEEKDQRPSSCSVSGFFRYLKEALGQANLDFSLEMSEEMGVFVSTQHLTLAVLNVFQFAFLYEGETKLEVSARKGEEKNEISFSFADRNDLFADCFSVLSGKSFCNQSIFLSPLLCVAALCGKEGIEMRVEKTDRGVSVILSLPKADHVPDSFLSDVASFEARELEKMVRELFLKQ